MKKENGAGINSFSGGVAAGMGVQDLLLASPLGAVQRFGPESGFQETSEL